MFDKIITAPAHHIILTMCHPWDPSMPPLALAYLASYLRSKGYKPLVYDFNAKLFNFVPDEKKKYWDVRATNMIPVPVLQKVLKEEFYRQITEFIEILSNRPEKIIGFSINYLNISNTAEIARGIKEKTPDKLIIFGGPGCFWKEERELVSPDLVDIFVIGEGEKPLYEIVNRYYQNKEFKDIKGTIVMKNEKSSDDTRPDVILNLDEVPYPTFQEFDLSDYPGDSRRTLPLIISRGCISKCSFCVDYLMCHPFRMRSPEHVIQELEYHIQFNKTNNFAFNDLLCNGDLKKLERLCDLIIERKLKIRWGSYAMARGDMTLELLKKMREAGCVVICYGLESGSDNVLKAMNKLYTASDAEKVLRLTQNAGIRAKINLIIGHPKEGKKEFKETLAFLKRNKSYIDSVIYISPLFFPPKSKLGITPSSFGIYFPKSPSSFKFIKLKKFIPGYYKIFGHNKPASELKNIDLNEFVTTKGNTKAVRLKRFVKMLLFIQRLNLFKEQPTIFVYATRNKKVKKIIQEVRDRHTLSNKYLLVKCNYRGWVEISYQNNLVTSEAGLKVKIKTAGRWYETSGYFWDIKKINSRKLKVNITMRNLKIKQEWTLILKKNSLIWGIKFYKQNEFNLEQIRMGICVSDTYSNWFVDRQIYIKPEDNKLPFILYDKPQIGYSRVDTFCEDQKRGRFFYFSIEKSKLEKLRHTKIKFTFK